MQALTFYTYVNMFLIKCIYSIYSFPNICKPVSAFLKFLKLLRHGSQTNSQNASFC